MAAQCRFRAFAKSSPRARRSDARSDFTISVDVVEPARARRGVLAVTGGYWAFTITDGALRMVVLLHFNALGFSPVEIAFLFVAYEAMGVLTNLIGGWVGTRTGLHRTLLAGLVLQVVVLASLTSLQTTWPRWWSVTFVMGLQALSGVAKDLTKMSAKTSVKELSGTGGLFRLVAMLTGSKNALKGVGFFVGAALLSAVGYGPALWLLAGLVAVAALGVVVVLQDGIAGASATTSLRSVLSPSSAINILSVARLFLFAGRDIWFVVAVPVFFADRLGWSETSIGAFMALWVIGYGIVQSFAPQLAPVIVGHRGDEVDAERRWALLLTIVTVVLAGLVTAGSPLEVTVVAGLIGFGVVFAVNSSLHSFLILAYSRADGAALDVGFYYSANAMGRLIGTILSGVGYMAGGLTLTLWVSAAFVAVAWVMSLRFPALDETVAR